MLLRHWLLLSGVREDCKVQHVPKLSKTTNATITASMSRKVWPRRRRHLHLSLLRIFANPAFVRSTAFRQAGKVGKSSPEENQEGLTAESQRRREEEYKRKEVD